MKLKKLHYAYHKPALVAMALRLGRSCTFFHFSEGIKSVIPTSLLQVLLIK